MATNFSVEISQDGRGGGILYRETGVGEFQTWWEFAGGNDGVLAFMSVPPSAYWDARVPWASGRRDEILARIGAEIIRQKATGYVCEIGEDFIHIRSAQFPSR